MRWAMVASGTRNAAAISRVVRPPTARSVRGIAAAGVRVGWQQRNIRISVSSLARHRLLGCGQRQRRREHLTAATGLVAAVLVDHPALGHADQPAEGVVGPALLGPLGRCRQQRLLGGVLGFGEVAVPADHHTEDLGRELAQQVLGAGSGAHTSGSGALSTSRTSMGCWIGTPSGPGAAEERAAISRARSRLSTSTRR